MGANRTAKGTSISSFMLTFASLPPPLPPFSPSPLETIKLHRKHSILGVETKRIDRPGAGRRWECNPWRAAEKLNGSGKKCQGTASLAAEKLNGSGKKCQGTSLLVPIKPIERRGL